MDRRLKHLLKFFAWIIVILVCATLANLDLLTAEQPPSNQAPSGEPTSATPAVPATPDVKSEMLQDPLYQAIREQLKSNRESLIPHDNVDGLNSAQWKAAELILRAASILEKEENRKAANGNSRSEVQIKIIRQLRASAIEIVRSEK